VTSLWQQWRRGFALEVLSALAKAPKVRENGDCTQYIYALSAELDDGLVLEHVRVEFLAMTSAKPPDVLWKPVESWETLCREGRVRLAHTSPTDDAPIYTYTFDQPSFARNLPRVRRLVNDVPPDMKAEPVAPAVSVGHFENR